MITKLDKKQCLIVSNKEKLEKVINAVAEMNIRICYDELDEIRRALKLFDEAIKFVEQNASVKHVEFVNRIFETYDMITKNYSPEFINEIIKAFDGNGIYHVHGGCGEKIIESGLIVGASSNGDLSHTCVPVGFKNPEAVLEAVLNWEHKDAKQMVLINAKNNDLIKENNKYQLDKKFIKCYIDSEIQQVVYNPNYVEVYPIKRSDSIGNFNVDDVREYCIASTLNDVELQKYIENQSFFARQHDDLQSILASVLNGVISAEVVNSAVAEFKKRQEFFRRQLPRLYEMAIKNVQSKPVEPAKAHKKTKKTSTEVLTIDNTQELF